MYSVYVLHSETGVVYIGQTDNLEKRLAQHNSGKSAYTNRCKHWELVYEEECPNRTEALKRERQLKSGRGRVFIQDLLRKKLGS